MTQQQLPLLSTLRKKEERQAYVEWTITGITDEAIMELQDLDLIFVDIGEGFLGSLRTLSLTAKGHDFIKDYCDACECMPCDCGWGQH